MKLSYRGNKYKNESSLLEVTEGEIGGNYRGQPWRFQYVRHIPQPAPVHDLKYRGVAYRIGQPTIAKPTSVEQPVAAVTAKILPNHHKGEVLDQITQTHLANIRSSLERRMQVAKARGDERLVQLLEKEQTSFSRQ